MKLYEHQKKAVASLRNGNILVGGVGSGKSLTGLYYYFTKVCSGDPVKLKMKLPTDLYIITTARKRDSGDWQEEMLPFSLYEGDKEKNKIHRVNVIIDSWNNISKYTNVGRAFFIFDEQRLVSSGVWSKSMIKISRRNQWILLSATPGDSWIDYCTVFIANGFFRNKTDFTSRHCVYSRFSKFPKIERYIEEERLQRMRAKIVVNMPVRRKTVRHHVTRFCKFNKTLYSLAQKKRWNVFEDKPCKDAGEMCRVLRRIVNESPDRTAEVCALIESNDRVIIFYNYNYELELLRKCCKATKRKWTEWNGSVHQLCLDDNHKKWVYLVQYTAGAEAWNCIATDTIIFYSANYSYKIMEQSAGRIDRINTKFVDLYYYHLMSKSSIDSAIDNAIKRKKKFNEKIFVERM